MKRSGTTVIFVIVWVAVLLGAYGLGLCIREMRFRQAKLGTKTEFAEAPASTEIQKPSDTTKSAREPAEMIQVPPEIKPTPRPQGGPGQGPGGLREAMAMFQALQPEEAAQLRERWPSMSEQERQQLMTEMRQRWENMSEEQRQQVLEKRRAEMQQRRDRFESMSPEEREKFRAEMRQRFGGRFGRRQRQNE